MIGLSVSMGLIHREGNDAKSLFLTRSVENSIIFRVSNLFS